MTLTEELAGLALETSDREIGEGAVDAAKLLLLDALGCALGGCLADGCQETVQLMSEWGGKPEAAILFSGSRAPAPQAAFANSMFIHALDYDDIYVPGTLHISSLVVPAMLAMGEMHGSTGRQALVAVVLGVEVAARLAFSEKSFRRGNVFLPTSLAGGFGAVATAARLMGLGTERCVHAMGINYAQVSGNRQALLDSTLTKRMQPAFAVRSALWSTALAARGLTGPHRALEGRAGYFRTYNDMPEPPGPGSFAGISGEMQIQRVAFKHFPSCGISHPCQLAAEALRDEEGLAPGEIAKVEIFGVVPGGLVSRPFEIGANPQVDAQFSVTWAVAHTLLRGRARLSDYEGVRVVADDEVLRLARSIGYIDTPPGLPAPLEVPDGYGSNSTQWHGVVVTLRDGGRLLRYRNSVQAVGPANQTKEQLIQKFRDCAAYSEICSGVLAEEIIEHVLGLDEATGLEGLLSCLYGLSPSIPAEQ